MPQLARLTPNRPPAPPCHAQINRCYKRKYVPAPTTDAIIRDAYLQQRQGDRDALKLASRRIGWSRSAVAKRGAELGITRIKELPWSPEEERLLEQFGYLTPSGIQRQFRRGGWNRSVAAIQMKLNRNRIKSNLDGYSACSLARAMGIDVHKVLGWIQRGSLRADQRQTERTAAQGGDTWWIKQKDVRQFVLRCPDEVDLARVEKIWFLDLVTGGKLRLQL